MLRRWIIRSLPIVCVVLALGAFAAFAWYVVGNHGPSTLVIQVNAPWKSVQVDSHTPLTFHPNGKPIRLTLRDYGSCSFTIQFDDGKELWLECFHSDTDRAKTFDVAIHRSAHSESVKVETTCTYRLPPPFSTHDVIDIPLIDRTSGTIPTYPTRIWGGP